MPTRILRCLVTAAALVLSVTDAHGQTVSPQPASVGYLVVDVRDYASVPRVDMAHALAEVTAIFRRAGVPIVCLLERRTPADRPSGQSAGRTTAVTVHIYSRLAEDRIVDDDRILGAAPGAFDGGRLALIFAGRIESLAKRRAAGDYGRLLGIVIAHEIGHVLLRGRPHSRIGVMRPVCDNRQLRQASMGALAFTPDETAAIRTALF